MKLFNSNRCKMCGEERATRECLRKGNKIGWSCCNSMRYDMKCPDECSYNIPKSKDGALAFKFKSDSLKETNDAVLKLFDLWSLKVFTPLGNKSPKELSESDEGRAELEKYFSKVQFLNTLPINEMREKLNLPAIEYKKANDFEVFAEQVMMVLGEQDWDKYIDLYYKPEIIKEEANKKKFLKRNNAFKAFKKINQYNLISSSLNEDGTEALCHFDVNNKAELTLNIIKINDEWRVKARLLGDPQLIYGEETAIKHIAGLISKNQNEELFNLCNKYSKIYPDSADIEHYWGMFYIMSQNTKEARKHFTIARMLDPGFAEPLYYLGFIHHIEKNDVAALEIYQEVLKIDPNDIKSINNSGIIYIERKEWAQAIAMFEKCVELNPDYDIATSNIKLIKRKMAEENEKKR